ncbi:MAG TPA: hypothetical protein VEC35_20930 [Noviherbaspirillum sp.]|nr:hypothetical protein [Noviherbaspirillum sp.]
MSDYVGIHKMTNMATSPKNPSEKSKVSMMVIDTCCRSHRYRSVLVHWHDRSRAMTVDVVEALPCRHFHRSMLPALLHIGMRTRHLLRNVELNDELCCAIATTQREPASLTLGDLTVNVDGLSRESILADWTWLIGATKLPILLTASGDAFVHDIKDGSVHLLDVGAGTLTKVADSVTEFHTRLSDKQFVSDHFTVEMIADLTRK